MIDEFSQEEVKISQRDWKMLFGGIALAASAVIGIDWLIINSRRPQTNTRQAVEYVSGRLDYGKGVEMVRSLGYRGELPAGRTEFEIKNVGGKRVLSIYVPATSQQTQQGDEISWTSIIELPLNGLEARALEK